ncbi:nitrous oxide reductase accessory protein NosL [Thiohalobacter thiocyanaticus]|uniref:Nitrous oxide reductase accessory protein NosL n=1 Tax=Thiohalobacter thiocyanaticus TaxID=585455 RepID=A0A426QJ51_9GAMM|nr:nitrous oxide reductase accessory protein NosL [Thiohalobacter thiocyanaticus]RRQ21775.1 nitrous oxide reductase accessory protein NosL [Thiohalobacter thiocyanaticus]
MLNPRLYMFLLLPWLLAGCDEAPEPGRSLEPVAIEAGDECHVCGMIITRFPGPKGEVFVQRREAPLKFCSTRDLFVWLRQPESAAIVEAVYVHDMGQAAWDSPGLEHLIPAGSAWYVVGSGQRGAMGPTLASFAERGAAEAFAETHGGRVLGYEAIDLEVLEGMTRNEAGMQHD